MMQIEAIFENIAERIQQEISQARRSITIAVDRFTNKSLFNELLKKAEAGCVIDILISDDEINRNSSIDFAKPNSLNFHIYWIGNAAAELIHNKFCVIDHSVVITGSYNWSNNAEDDFENIIVTSDDNILAEQFVYEFYRIRNLFYPNETNEKEVHLVGKIVRRLEILKNYILLEDIEEVRKETAKLKIYSINSDIKELIDQIESGEFANAVSKIEFFLSGNQQLSVWADSEIIALKFEIRNLESQFNAFDNEKIELEKLLLDFHHRHTLELGDLILEILRLRKLKFRKNKSKYEEAEFDETRYRDQISDEKGRTYFELTEDQKRDLKKFFRRASVLCHPDKVKDEQKDLAHEIFLELKAAYDANDIENVRRILNNLEVGNFFKSKSETVNEKELLKIAISEIRRKIKIIEDEIMKIKESETFKIINSIQDWDEYFIITKRQLSQELEELQKEVSILSNRIS